MNINEIAYMVFIGVYAIYFTVMAIVLGLLIYCGIDVHKRNKRMGW